MLEKRQKGKAPPPQQLDLVESINQTDRLFTKRRLIAFVLTLSVLSSLFFMIYGQVIKGKPATNFQLPSFKFSFPSSAPRQVTVSPLNLPVTVNYISGFMNLNSPSPSWQLLTPASSIDFSPPANLDTLLVNPTLNDPVLAKLPTGLVVTHYQQLTDSSLNYYISFNSPRHHFLLAYKFIGTKSELSALIARLPDFVESAYWQIVPQL